VLLLLLLQSAFIGDADATAVAVSLLLLPQQFHYR